MTASIRHHGVWATLVRGALALALGGAGLACDDDGGATPGTSGDANVGSDAPADLPADTPTDTAPDVVTDTAPDTVTDTAPDAAPDAVADTAPDAVTDTPADTAPDAVADTAPDAVTDTVADTAPDAGPDALTDAAPDAIEDAGPDAASDTATDAAPDASDEGATDQGPSDVVTDVVGPSCGLDLPPAPGSCPDVPPVWAGLDPASFTLLPAIRDLDPAETVPDAGITYWELRYAAPDLGAPEPEVLLAWGTKCGDATDPSACAAAFDALTAESGFKSECLPGYCFHYLAVNAGDATYVITSPDEVAAMFAPLESAADAAIVAFAHGYGGGGSDVRNSGWRVAADGGYELVVEELWGDCDPVSDARWWLHLAKDDGAVSTLCRQLSNVLCGACI